MAATAFLSCPALHIPFKLHFYSSHLGSNCPGSLTYYFHLISLFYDNQFGGFFLPPNGESVLL